MFDTKVGSKKAQIVFLNENSMQGFEGFIEEYKNIQCRAGGDGRHFYPT